jgi:hypothetical protein
MDGTSAMAARLRAKIDAIEPMDNAYVNDTRAEILMGQARDAGGVEQAPFDLRARLAEELLLAGRSAESVEILDGLGEQLKKLGRRASPQMVAMHRRMLTLACLRVGEQENCLMHHNPESCLMPMTGGGLHIAPEGSERALELLLQTLADEPDDDASRWLLNVAAMTLGEWPGGVSADLLVTPESFASEYDPGHFPDVAAQAGASVIGLAGGVVMDDLDGDGRLDLLTSAWGLEDPLRFFHNAGDGTFEDRTAGLGLDGITGGLNMVQADHDNDGDLDVLVLRGAWFEEDGGWPNSLLRNEGGGRFVDVTEAAGLLSSHPTQTAAWGDYDLDGWVDLFIGNETGPHEVHPCELFHNDGDGTFTDVTVASGISIEHYVKGVVWGDIDEDGDPDLYASRSDGPNLLLRNDGPLAGAWERGDPNAPPERRAALDAVPWKFTERGKKAGVSEPRRSFPTWFYDYDNDGLLDILVSGFRYNSTGWVARDIQGLKNKGVKGKLFRNRGDGSFEDVSEAAGVNRVLQAMGCNLGDLDNDGWKDFYVATGEPDYGALYPNRMFRHDGEGYYQDVTTAGGFGHVQKGHGVAFGDLDHDGDQDVYAVMGGAYSGDVFPNSLFRNPGNDNGWVTLRLVGVEANRAAIGARVRARVDTPEGPRDIHALVGSGGSFGASSLQVELGLGDASALSELQIRWPGSGRVQTLRDLPMQAVLTIVEGSDDVAVARPGAFTVGS